jgi:transposase
MELPIALNRLLIVSILLISTAPLYAQRQQQNVTKLKEDARKVVGTIATDKTKAQTYCQILDLGRQLERADQEKDRKRVKTLAEKIDQLQKQLGPEFVALMNGLMRIDRRSPDSQEIALILESLDQSCPD